MFTIWKFNLSQSMNGDRLWMPLGAQMLTVQVQDGMPRLWALVASDAEKVEYRVWVRGTGQDIEMGIRECYIGTWQDGPFVWHVFARPA